jgi:hypothetical protein
MKPIEERRTPGVGLGRSKEEHDDDGNEVSYWQQQLANVKPRPPEIVSPHAGVTHEPSH